MTVAYQLAILSALLPYDTSIECQSYREPVEAARHVFQALNHGLIVEAVVHGYHVASICNHMGRKLQRELPYQHILIVRLSEFHGVKFCGSGSMRGKTALFSRTSSYTVFGAILIWWTWIHTPPVPTLHFDNPMIRAYKYMYLYIQMASPRTSAHPHF